MKITVVGATGRTARHVLAQGLRRGHQMTALTSRPQALDDRSGLAAVVHGEGRHPHAVREAINGADAVICAVPGASRNDPHRLADLARVLTRAMADLGVKHLVVTSAYPIIVDKPSLGMAVLRRLLATSYADSSAMVRIVEASGLDWTIAYLNRLTDKPATGKVQTSHGLLATPRAIARADVAATLLDIVEDNALAKIVINVAGA
jgi:putative NADH-flavin reductase